MLGKTERKWNSWGPWPPNSGGSSPVQTTPRYDVQPANRGDNPWKDCAKEVRDAQPEYKAKSGPSSWHTPAGGANAWGQQWGSSSSTGSIILMVID